MTHNDVTMQGHWLSSAPTVVWFTCCSTGVLKAAFLLKGASGMNTRVTPYRKRYIHLKAGAVGGAVGGACPYSDSLLYVVSPIAGGLFPTQTVFLERWEGEWYVCVLPWV